MKSTFQFIQVTESMSLPNGIYNGRYNKEPAIIRIKDHKPNWVQFIGFIKHYEGEDKRCDSCIYDAKGIMISNVEVLLPAQEFNVYQEMQKAK